MMPSTTIRRRIEWMDTDAAGIWHYSTATRFAEAAETGLHRQLGIVDLTFGLTPRAHVEFDFHHTVRFDEILDITLAVSDVGTTSVTYDVTMTSDREPVATGRVVAVHIDENGMPSPWPETVREALDGTAGSVG